jgi:hypothetical protein
MKKSRDPEGRKSPAFFLHLRRGIGNGFMTNLYLQLRLRGSRPGGESSKSSGGDMTPPDLELNQS